MNSDQYRKNYDTTFGSKVAAHPTRRAPLVPGTKGFTEDADYQHLLLCISTSLQGIPANEPLFATANSEHLFDHFLSALPASRRQHYQCRHCRHFVNTYGGAVRINPFGVPIPVFWRDGGRGIFTGAVACLYGEVTSYPTRGLLIRGLLTRPLSRALGWGTHASGTPKAQNGQFFHMYSPGRHLPTDGRGSEVREEVEMLDRALREYPAPLPQRALDFFETSGAARGEKHVDQARWFAAVSQATDGMRRSHTYTRNSLLWGAAANAPAGFCHVRTTILGTVLDDLKTGVSHAILTRKYQEKMHPLAYQRPQAPPKAGTIDQAERLFAEKGLDRSLERRFATFDEVKKHAFWTPSPVVTLRGDDHAYVGGVFHHLRPATTIVEAYPERTVTWRKFREDVLPSAGNLEYLVPTRLADFYAMVTARYPDATPILQWDAQRDLLGNVIGRNPVNWYLYFNGSQGRRWGLVEGAWCKVVGITPPSNMWQAGFERFGNGAYLALEGAADSDTSRTGLALFPEELRGDLHGVRSVIEAASKVGRIWPAPTGARALQLACGVALQKTEMQPASDTHLHLRTTSTHGQKALWCIDRWE